MLWARLHWFHYVAAHQSAQALKVTFMPKSKLLLHRYTVEICSLQRSVKTKVAHCGRDRCCHDVGRFPARGLGCDARLSVAPQCVYPFHQHTGGTNPFARRRPAAGSVAVSPARQQQHHLLDDGCSGPGLGCGYLEDQIIMDAEEHLSGNIKRYVALG
jgi:hypothetical protein